MRILLPTLSSPQVSKLNESIDRHTVIVDEQKAILDAVTESCFIEIEVVKRNQAAVGLCLLVCITTRCVPMYNMLRCETCVYLHTCMSASIPIHRT